MPIAQILTQTIWWLTNDPSIFVHIWLNSTLLFGLSKIVLHKTLSINSNSNNSDWWIIYEIELWFTILHQKSRSVHMKSIYWSTSDEKNKANIPNETLSILLSSWKFLNKNLMTTLAEIKIQNYRFWWKVDLVRIWDDYKNFKILIY